MDCRNSAKNQVKGIFNNKICCDRVEIKSEKVKVQSTLKCKTKRKSPFSDYEPVKYAEALWLMMRGRPPNLVNDPEYRYMKKRLDNGVQYFDRKTIVRAEQVIHGFVYQEVLKRIHASHKKFNMPFISIHGDCWTSQANVSVFGVSISYYDFVTRRVETIVLYCAPLIHGKRAKDLEKILNSVLKQFKIKHEWIMQCVSDDEGGVRNAFKNTFKDAQSMKHVLHTNFKHYFVMHLL